MKKNGLSGNGKSGLSGNEKKMDCPEKITNGQLRLNQNEEKICKFQMIECTLGMKTKM